MFIDFPSHLKELRKLNAIILPKLERVLATKPALRAFCDHWGVVRYCSIDVNPVADIIEMTHRTNGDATALEILPSIIAEGIHVYSDPPIIVVGHRNPNGFGEVPLSDWKELLTDNNMSREVIRKVGQYLKGHAPVNYDQVPESDTIKAL